MAANKFYYIMIQNNLSPKSIGTTQSIQPVASNRPLFDMNRVKPVSMDELFSWITTAIEKEEYRTYEISLDGTSEKCEGYIGEIVFLKVAGRDIENKEKTLNLVVKHSKQNEHLRTSVFRFMFEAEIHFYEKVYPVFERFQLEKNVPVIFNAVPKCLKVMRLDKKEVLIFENLKAQGYELYNRKKPLNIFHIKAVLEQLGKLHALSFALRDQRKTEFEAVTKNYPNFLGNFLPHRFIRRCFGTALNNGLKILLDHGEFELVDKFKEMLSEYVDDVADIMTKIVEEDETQSVIVHGDGWNNNFMFKYQGNNRNSPSNVAILDFQLSYLRSPALDLSYVFYGTASAKELKHFNHLMETYYDSFSSFLRALGSNPEELFPISSLKKHWKRYSTFGVIFSSFLLTFVLCDEVHAPVLEDLESEASLQDMLVIDISRNELYFQRFRDVVRHYFECTF